jgi:hypothetical protein
LKSGFYFFSAVDPAILEMASAECDVDVLAATAPQKTGKHFTNLFCDDSYSVFNNSTTILYGFSTWTDSLICYNWMNSRF